MLAIYHDDKAGFFAIQEFLNHDAVACITKGVTGQHVADGVFRLLQRHGNNHAFARSQAIGFHHDGCALLAYIIQCLVHVGEIGVGGGGNVLAIQKVLGEGLGAFQLCGTGTGAEHPQTTLFEQVYNAINQRRLGADNGQSHVIGRGKVRQAVEIHHVNVDVFQAWLAGGAGVAGGNKHPVSVR